tara:strand:+ start:37 stop:354 length:318 start_codon:yes stop_codon:yes gene_type:complete
MGFSMKKKVISLIIDTDLTDDMIELADDILEQGDVNHIYLEIQHWNCEETAQPKGWPKRLLARNVRVLDSDAPWTFEENELATDLRISCNEARAILNQRNSKNEE